MKRPGPSPVVRAALPLVLSLLGALSVSACRTATPTRASIPEELEASALFIYPVGLRWEEPAWRTFELSQRLVDTALARMEQPALLFGPTEFTVYRPEDDNAWAASDAVTRLAPYGVKPEQALVLRAWVARHIQSGQREMLDARGRPLGRQSAQETKYLGHVEVLHPSTQQLLVEADGEAVVNPFAERTDEGADPAPELTELLEELTRRVLAALGPSLKPPRAPSPALATVALVPWEAFSYSERGRPAFASQLASMDELDAELLRQQRLRFANPHLPAEHLPRLSRLPAGLYVLEAPSEGPLAPGELILSLDGAAALPQALARARLAPTPVKARVRLPDGAPTERLLP